MRLGQAGVIEPRDDDAEAGPGRSNRAPAGWGGGLIERFSQSKPPPLRPGAGWLLEHSSVIRKVVLAVPCLADLNGGVTLLGWSFRCLAAFISVTDLWPDVCSDAE